MIDLHSHSTISDGTDEPETVVALAARAGLTALALTDHDTLHHIERARTAGIVHDLDIVTGCELSCDTGDDVHGSLHLLVYFVEPGCELDGHLDALQVARSVRNEAMIARLNELGVAITLEEVTEEAGGYGVGRPHIGAVMMRHGYVASMSEAFERYLGHGASAYVERDRLDVATAIELAHASRGVAVIAHPHTLRLDDSDLDNYLTRLRAMGLDGLECMYSSYTPAERAAYAGLARRHDLAVTGGSDYHGSHKPDTAVGVGRGDLAVDDELLYALWERRA
jgi:predicted metal-dependent phosphoesterase TrpH